MMVLFLTYWWAIFENRFDYARTGFRPVTILFLETTRCFSFFFPFSQHFPTCFHSGNVWGNIGPPTYVSWLKPSEDDVRWCYPKCTIGALEINNHFRLFAFLFSILKPLKQKCFGLKMCVGPSQPVVGLMDVFFSPVRFKTPSSRRREVHMLSSVGWTLNKCCVVKYKFLPSGPLGKRAWETRWEDVGFPQIIGPKKGWEKVAKFKKVWGRFRFVFLGLDLWSI